MTVSLLLIIEQAYYCAKVNDEVQWWSHLLLTFWALLVRIVLMDEQHGAQLLLFVEELLLKNDVAFVSVLLNGDCWEESRVLEQD